MGNNMNTSKLKASTRDSLLRKIAVFIGSCVYTTMTLAAPDLPNSPLGVTTSAAPMTLLVSSKDHKMFFEAYDDASDINGDGILDLDFKPNITYYGLFEPDLCYDYGNGTFTPDGETNSLYECRGNAEWSGNWLNYITTSRIDALRKVLYGGYRDIDTASRTVLKRAYIPQDGHSWAKSYDSPTLNGYDISRYTALSRPNSNRRHLFGNLTRLQNNPNNSNRSSVSCNTLSNCSDRDSLMVVIQNTQKKVWDWASKERPVLDGSHGGSRTDYKVHVDVCTSQYNAGCKQYSNGNYKPVGLLHEYGEDGSMLFGLLTGSYNSNMSGGVLRSTVKNIDTYIDSNTGVFNSNSHSIFRALDSIRIRDFNHGNTDMAYRNGSYRTGPMQEGRYVDWGNPIAEMLYEGVRYFSGKKSATSDFAPGGYDSDVFGENPPTWDDPYELQPWCSKPNIIVMSDVYPSYDSDSLPGSAFSTFSGDLGGLNVSTYADEIFSKEPDASGMKFIGQSTLTNDDRAPTAKNITAFSTVRGLAPEEPTKEGSYYSPAVTYFAKTNDISPKEEDQNIDTFVVALASTLPEIKIPVAGGRFVTIVPFAKTIDGASTNRTKGRYQPSDPIVDFYVEEFFNFPGAPSDSSKNNGRPYANFRINYEADEQGNDFDMDVVSEYIVELDAQGRVVVKVRVVSESTGSNQNIGYVISGTNRDGIYLVAQDKNEALGYFLNVPPGESAGYCDNPATINTNACAKLPYLGSSNSQSEQTFVPSTTSSAGFLKNPLWYAAKWGGFYDRNDNNVPDLDFEWDEDGDGVPDTYFPVQNPIRLREALKKALDNIVARSAAAGNVTSNGQSISDDSYVFSTIFNSANWSGNLFSYKVDMNGVSPTASWNAASKLPAPSARSIYLSDGSDLKLFAWTNLSTTEKNALGNEQIVNWIRGDRSREQQNGGVLRTRGQSVLGDFVHSSPYYAKDTDTVYVGANDGMLHAFDADTGIEQFAYIPSVFLNSLKNTTNPNYGTATMPHDYFVDGDVVVTNSNQTPGQNILIGTLGHGGKGLYALDVTTPSSFSTGNLLWERFDSTDADLGFMLGRPQVAALNDGNHWAIVGNGYNSTSGKAVLYLIKLDDNNNTVIKIDTGAGSNNALSTPALFDEDDDGVVDYVYAGDMNGNMWKFDLSAKQTKNWKVAYKSGNTPVPLFKATDGFGNPQPITAQPTVTIATGSSAPFPGARYILFGTGSYFRTNDPYDDQVQSWYGIIDSGSDEMTRSQLKERGIDARTDWNGTTVRTFEDTVDGDMSGMSGWFIDFDLMDDKGERIVTSSKVYQFIEPVLIASSIIPVVDPCIPGGRGYINAINPYTGGSLTVNFLDVSDDGAFNDELNDKPIGSFDPGIGMPSEHVIMGNRLVVGGSTGEVEDRLINTGGVKKTGRMSWREILQE
jgi:type IV pilus assembly protein PilY1